MADTEFGFLMEEMKILIGKLADEHAESVTEHLEGIAEDFMTLVREPDDILFEELLAQARTVRGILRVRMSSWSRQVLEAVVDFGARLVRSLLSG